MIDLTKWEGYPSTPKVWGRELTLVNNQHYCSKLMEALPNFQCSLHKHNIKHETFFVLQGVLGVQFGNDPSKLTTEFKGVGDPLAVPPGLWHRFWAVDGPCLFLEVSTTHSDQDVERAEPSGPIGPF